MNKRLETLIDKFLLEKRKSEGNRYAEVTTYDMEYLYRIVAMLIELKFEPDADGDYPVNFKMTDLTKYEKSHFVQIPLWLGRENDNSAEILRGCILNNSMAAETLKIFSDMFCRKTAKING